MIKAVVISYHHIAVTVSERISWDVTISFLGPGQSRAIWFDAQETVLGL